MADSETQGTTQYVYLIGCAENSLVKVGRSINVAARLAEIQYMSPVRLYVLWQVEGDAELESALHRLFAGCRSHGEWFDFTGCANPVDLVADAVMQGLHEVFPTKSNGEGFPLRAGDMVKIVASDWTGPRTGVIHGERRVLDRLQGYYVGGLGEYAPSYEFKPHEVRPMSIPGLDTPIKAPEGAAERTVSTFNSGLLVPSDRSAKRPHHPGRRLEKFLAGI